MKQLQHGFSIITAIFLLVVLSFLGVAMVTLSTSQHQSSAMDVMGARAYQAARAGIEWGAYQVLVVNGGCAAASGVQALNGFSITVGCSLSAHSDVSATTNPVSVYELTSTANQGTAGQVGFVERQIRVSIAK